MHCTRAHVFRRFAACVFVVRAKSIYPIYACKNVNNADNPIEYACMREQVYSNHASAHTKQMKEKKKNTTLPRFRVLRLSATTSVVSTSVQHAREIVSAYARRVRA